MNETNYKSFKYFTVTQPAPYVAHVQINRPKSMNSFTEATWREFHEVFNQLSKDEDVRAIVLSGTGKAFCSGLDLKEATSKVSDSHSTAAKRVNLHDFITEFQNSIKQPHDIRKPVIGVAHGVSLGLAIDILTATDIRIASKDALLSIKEVQVGLAADMGTLQRMPKLVKSISWLKELAYTGRNFTAEEAHENGFFSYVYDTKELAVAKAVDLAKEIAANAPIAVQGTKYSINYALDHSIEEGLSQIADYNAFTLWDEMAIALTAMKKKTKPVFPKL